MGRLFWCPRASTPNPSPAATYWHTRAATRQCPPVRACPRGLLFRLVDAQDPIDDDNLHVEDNLEQFAPISGEDLAYLKAESERLEATGKAVLARFGGTGFGDIGRLPGMQLRHPRGIRAIEEWYVSLSLRQELHLRGL